MVGNLLVWSGKSLYLRGDVMRRNVSFFLVLSLVVLLNACVSINRNNLLEKEVPVEFNDISSNIVVTSHLDKPGYVAGLRKKVIESTKLRLKDMGIQVAEQTQNAAKLTYDIKSVTTTSKNEYDYKGSYEIKYVVTFETSDGKLIFNDSDEKEDSNMDDVVKSISKRVARSIYNSYRDNTAK